MDAGNTSEMIFGTPAQDGRGFDANSLAFVEGLYAQWLSEPASIDPEWARYFSTLGNGSPADELMRSALGPSLKAPSLFDPERPRALTNGRVDRPPEEEVRRLLAAVPMFASVSDDELTPLTKIVRQIIKKDGEYLFRAGDSGSELYVVVSGAVMLRRERRVVAHLGPGEVVGEMAVLDGMPRAVDAMAVGEARLLEVRGEDLLELVERRPAVARGIIAMLTRRLRNTSARQDAVDQLMRAYRVRGHLAAHLNPLGPPGQHPELNPEYYGLTAEDMEQVFSSQTIPGSSSMTLSQILDHLRNVYCRSIGVQYMHIDDIEVKDWIQQNLEGPTHGRRLTRDDQLRILIKLTDAEIFEQFIHRKFLGAKRFSLEGAESLIPLLDLAVEEAGDYGVEEIVIGMAHRGRLNVLANVLQKSPRAIFKEFADDDPKKIAKMRGSGDVKYHLGYSHDRTTAAGHRIHLTLCFNPSHLAFVAPVVAGRVRAKQDRYGDRERWRRMGIAIHGDAAFAGQGVVQEMLNMSELAGFTTGGTLHIVVNNQIGFTTPPESGRSTHYATDVARMLQIPVFHVNGEHPEAVARVIELAIRFRHRFKKDVVIDMYCYRRYGHNETDEPEFTQPVLYREIKSRKSVREGYLDSLLALGEVTRQEADQIAVERREHLDRELTASRQAEWESLQAESGTGVWRPYSSPADRSVLDVDTSVSAEKLRALLLTQARVPDGFVPHPKIEKLFELRRAQADGKRPLDWAGGEMLAYASLLSEGVRIRLSGQDVGRGTFSHRHAILFDNRTGRPHIPLRYVAPSQGSFEAWDSPLTEIAVLGFEYGYSLDTPDGLTIWEAQFGDFVNVGQVIIDQFLMSGEDKWARMTGLVLFLPHGYEGQGPEHSSARVERFLTLAAEDNVRIVNLTTPAQLFHCLRRQIVGPKRKPLVVLTPKSLLRHPRCVSNLELMANAVFEPVIEDLAFADRSRARRMLLTSGKLYYELDAYREQHGIEDVSIVRLEQYYPLRFDRLERALEGYPPNAELMWVQEEPRNMGAWPFLRLHCPDGLFGRALHGITRPASASPATGSAAAHAVEQRELIERAFAR